MTSVERRTYPAGPATLLGQELMLEGTDPLIMLTTSDRRVTFYLSGGLAPFPGHQDGLQLVEMSTPTPEFTNLYHQGARQDGRTYGGDTVYDGMEMHAILAATATTADGLSDVVAEWVAANNPRQLCRLEWFTPKSGLWWCDVRLDKRWIDRLQRSPRRMKKQVLTNVWMNEQAFWSSVDSTSTFAFDYADFIDTFNYDTRETGGGLGDDWPLYYGPTTPKGYIYADGSQARWKDDPDDWIGTDTQEVVCGPYKDFHTATDNQVVSIVLGGFQEWSFPDQGANDIWVRMGRNPDGSWNGDGYRLRMQGHWLKLSRFKSFSQTVLWQRPMLFPPFYGEKWTLIAGTPANPHQFRILRFNGAPAGTFTENPADALIGPENRGVGFGMQAGAALLTQATPASVRKISAGDNATVTQEGWLNLTNIGDQDGWPQFLFHGPGSLEISNGPGGDMISFAKTDPLRDGQVVLISTHPRYRHIVDLTPDHVDTSQPLTAPQKLVKELVRLVSMGQVPPALQWLQSVFGIAPPQGVLYSLLDGRFDRPIPGVPQPRDAKTSKIAVRVTGGNASTRVVASLTPMRTWPEFAV